MEYIKNCPACGGHAGIVQIDTLHEVICRKCTLNIRGDSREEVIKKWNSIGDKIHPINYFKKVSEFCDQFGACNECPALHVGCHDRGSLPYEWVASMWEEEYDQ